MRATGVPELHEVGWRARQMSNSNSNDWSLELQVPVTGVFNVKYHLHQDDGTKVADFSWNGSFSVIEPIPSTPSPPSASDGTYTDKVRVSWSAVSGATSYQVYRSTSSSTNGSLINSLASTSYDDTGASAGTSYYYKIKACNSSGCSNYSSANSGYKQTPPDNPPTVIINTTGSGDNNPMTSNFTLCVSVSDDIALQSVAYQVFKLGVTAAEQIDSVNLSGTSGSANFAIDVNSLAVGSYKIKVLASDTKSQVSTAQWYWFQKITASSITNLQITETNIPNITGELAFTATVSEALPAGQTVFINFDNQQGSWLLDTDAGGHLELQHQGGLIYSSSYILEKPGLRSVRAGIFDLNGDVDPNNDLLIGSYSNKITCTLPLCLAAKNRPNGYGAPAAIGNGSELFKQVDVANGNYHLSLTDMAVSGKGPSFAFSRAYNSLAEAAEQWSFGYEAKAQFIDLYNREIAIGPREDGHVQYYFKDMDNTWYALDSGNFDQLIENSDGTFVLYTQGNRFYRFEAPLGTKAGRLNTIEDRLNHALTFNYTSNNLIGATDANGRSYVISRDANNRIQRVTYFANRFVEYSYDSNGMITAVKNMRGNSNSYNYINTTGDDRYRLKDRVDPLNKRQVSIAYNAEGQVSSLLDGDNQLTNFIYRHITSPSTSLFLGKQMTAIEQPAVDGLNHNLAFVLDDNRTRIESRLDAQNAGDYDSGFHTRQTYQIIDSRLRMAEQGLVTKVVEPKSINITDQTLEKGTAISYSPTAKGRPTKIVDAKNNETSAIYAELNSQNLSVIASTTQPGVASGTYFQGFTTTGKAGTITGPRGFTTSRAFDITTDWVTQSTDARNNSTAYTYDVFGHVKTTTDALSGQINRNYDALGRLIGETSELGLVTSYSYDNHNNVLTKTEVATGINYTTQYSYDASDNLVSTIDPEAHQTNYFYDTLNRKIEDRYLVNNVQHSRHYAYDAVGRLKSITNERGQTSATHYDARSHVSSKVNPLLQTTVSYTYDKNGNIATTTDAEGRTVTTSYDEINRKTRVEDDKGNYQTWAYNAAGHVASYRDRPLKIRETER